MGDFRLVKMAPIGAFRGGRSDKAARLNPVNNAIRRAVRPALLIGELSAKLTERLSFHDSLSTSNIKLSTSNSKGAVFMGQRLFCGLPTTEFPQAGRPLGGPYMRRL